MRTWKSAFILSTILAGGQAATDLGWKDGDSDLTHFVTRPEIKAPLFTVSKIHPEQIAPGYWFIAPYSRIIPPPHLVNYYQACQTGPAIYDNDGNLVWSGACEFRNRNACDFRLDSREDAAVLSAIIMRDSISDQVGHGVTMNENYDVMNTLDTGVTINTFNMHELNLHGESAIHIMGKPVYVDLGGLNISATAGWVYDMGFREIDVLTGEVLFEFWALDSGQINLTESSRYPTSYRGPPPSAWNWFHANAVDKNSDGDYLFNSRYCDTMFKISGRNSEDPGKVLWRLGGSMSSFTHEDDFVFSREHDPRWIETSAGRDVITFLDNAAADDERGRETSNASRALTVELDYESMTARMLQEIKRPDGEYSRLRGNVQTLPGGNKFICWSENSKISEHAADGTPLMYAEFQSKRFVTYRGYKFDGFVGIPREKPVIKAYAFGGTRQSSTLAIYVSWNGATEVERWRFRDQNGAYVGETPRRGFETFFQIDGITTDVTAEAIAANGSTIGRSLPAKVILPDGWNLSLYDSTPKPDAMGNIESPSTLDEISDRPSKNPASVEDGINTTTWPWQNEEGLTSIDGEGLCYVIILAMVSGMAIGYGLHYLKSSKREKPGLWVRTLNSPQESQRLALSPISTMSETDR